MAREDGLLALKNMAGLAVITDCVSDVSNRIDDIINMLNELSTDNEAKAVIEALMGMTLDEVITNLTNLKDSLNTISQSKIVSGVSGLARFFM